MRLLISQTHKDILEKSRHRGEGAGLKGKETLKNLR